MSTIFNPDLVTRKAQPRSAQEALAGLGDLHLNGSSALKATFATGFDPLDRVLDGGLRARDLTLVGGMPGVGKTVISLQWARQLALDGATAVYACYEHEEQVLLSRLLLLEAGELASPDATQLQAVRPLVSALLRGEVTIAGALERSPLLAEAHARLASYAGRLWLVRASGAHTGVAELDAIVSERRDGPTVLFVDYLQKVSVRPEPAEEAEKVTRVAEGLKELALEREVAVVAVVAADREGLAARRLRLHHLRGSSALAYEADVALIVNDKQQVVSKVHLAYDPVRAETFKHWAVLSIEKNRGGLAHIDLEFRKQFEHYRFDRIGSFVIDRLVDERLVVE
jgi:replicative DNA helicase